MGKARFAEIRVDSILGRNSNRTTLNATRLMASAKNKTEAVIVVFLYRIAFCTWGIITVSRNVARPRETAC